jgi:uncharacterized membrane protein YhhN
MNKSILKYSYLAVGVLNLVSWAWFEGEYTFYTKPLLMPLLMLYMYEESKGGVILGTLLLFLALVFSWGGDLALMYGDDFFLLGVGLFLITQLFYVIIFIRNTPKPFKPNWIKIGLVAIYGAGFFYILLPNVGALKIPIIIYGLTLLSMTAMSLMRDINADDGSYLLVAAGAILFLISDSLIAINKFVIEIPMDSVLVMSTYILAQYLIVDGLLKEFQHISFQKAQNR